MMKRTHNAVAIAITVPLILANPISVLGLIGATAPDWDFYLGMVHRGVSHSFLALFLTSGFIYMFDSKIAVVWFISYLSHIFLDSLTVTGVPYLYPLNRHRWYFAKLKTRSGEDYLIQLFAIAFICFNYLK